MNHFCFLFLSVKRLPRYSIAFRPPTKRARIAGRPCGRARGREGVGRRKKSQFSSSFSLVSFPRTEQERKAGRCSCFKRRRGGKKGKICRWKKEEEEENHSLPACMPLSGMCRRSSSDGKSAFRKLFGPRAAF